MTKDEVLKGLECCADFMCKGCPYQKFSDQTYTLRCMHRLMSDMEALFLKPGSWRLETDEEEPNPMFKHVVCSECGKSANNTYNFCPECGKRMVSYNG